LSQIKQLSATEFLQKLGRNIAVIDVRSPKEYKQGHILNAVNMPLFSDEERAIVGTLYKKQGREDAVEAGLGLVGPKLGSLVAQAKEAAPDRQIIVYCWRGGMRSNSVAWMLSLAGFTVHVLAGGYKAFRGYFFSRLENELLQITILGGRTGSGKTDVLHELAKLGEQVIDLEGLANHKGSSFGALLLPPQPTTEQFENLLFLHLLTLDWSKRIWVEDESKMIGTVCLNTRLWQQMQEAENVVIEVPIAERIERLVADYAKAPKELLSEALLRIKKRVGPQHCQRGLQALENDDFAEVAAICLQYYDKAYDYTLAEKHSEKLKRIAFENCGAGAIARELVKVYSN